MLSLNESGASMFYESINIATKQKPLTYTKGKKMEEPRHTTIEGHQITKEEIKRSTKYLQKLTNFNCKS